MAVHAFPSELGERLLRGLDIGIQEDQNDIDVRDPSRRNPVVEPRLLYEPRGDGRLVDRATHELLRDGQPGDNRYTDTIISYERLFEDNPDFKFATEVAGCVNISPYAFISEDNQRQFQMLSNNIRDALIADRRRRSVTLKERTDLITELNKQQAELFQVGVRLNGIYDSLAPTVKRWYWLGSMTGYLPAPTLTDDVDIRQRAKTDTSVIPYWFLVRYVRRQYANRKYGLVNGEHDWRYLEPFSKDFNWAKSLLVDYDTQINRLRTLPDVSVRIASLIYLTLRDAILSSAFRLVPPTTGVVGTATAPLEVDRYTWLASTPTNTTSPIGRYYSLPFYMEQTRSTVMKLPTLASITSSAITSDEARRVAVDLKFTLFTAQDQARGIVLATRIPFAKPLSYFTEKCAQHFLQPPFLSADIGVLRARNNDIDDAYETWMFALDAFADAMHGLSLDGLAYCIDLFSTGLVPLPPAQGGQNTSDFLLQQIPLLDSGHLLTWNYNSQPSLQNLLSHLLLWQDRAGVIGGETFQPRAVGSIHCVTSFPPNTRDVIVELTVLDNAGVIWPLVLTVNDLKGTLRDRWEELQNLLVDFATAVADETGVGTDFQCLVSALDLVATSLFLWSVLLQTQAFRSGLVGALKADVARSPNPNDILANLLATPYVAAMTTEIDPLLRELNRDGDIAAHFYKELFRSSFLSPYDRTRIHVNVQLTRNKDPLFVGDVDPAIGITRMDSDNQTIFTETWEQLYANLLTDRLPDPAAQVPPEYWRGEMQRLVRVTAAIENDPRDPPKRSILFTLWQAIEKERNYLPAIYAPYNGVPPVNQLQLAFLPPPLPPPPPPLVANPLNPAPAAVLPVPPTAGSEIIAESNFFQSVLLAFDKQWNRTIVPVELYESSVLLNADASERLPAMNLFHAMLIFVLAYYPRAMIKLRERQNKLAESLREAHEATRAIAANDSTYANREVNALLTDLYIPEQRWYMQAILTGRLVFVALFTTALHRAYTELQRLASLSDGQMNEYGKRFRSPPLDYSALKSVPLSILTVYTVPTTAHDYIDITRTSVQVLTQLRANMGNLVAQYIFQIRLNAPDQYKTTIQYQRAPVELQAALHGMLLFRFSSLGNKAWSVYLA